MSAFLAAAQDEDGDIISALRARVADLEAQLYAVGAGGVGKLTAQGVEDSALLGNIESPFNACMHQEHCKQWKQQAHHPEQHLDMVPAGWKLVPVEPGMSMTQSALNASRRWSEYEAPLPRGQELWAAGVCWEAMLAAAPKPPAVKESCWPKLDKPARVGGGTFGIGTSARHVVMAAQRAHDEHVRVGKLTHEQMVEEERNRRVLWDLIHGPIDTAPQPPVVEQPQSVTDCHQSQTQGEQKASWYHKHWGDGDDVFYSPTDGIPEGATPLYTRPQPKRQPLTDGEILMVLDAAEIPELPRDFRDVDIDIARAIERAVWEKSNG